MMLDVPDVLQRISSADLQAAFLCSLASLPATERGGLLIFHATLDDTCSYIVVRIFPDLHRMCG